MSTSVEKLKKPRINKNIRAENRFGFLLSLPAMIVFAVIILYPFLKSVYSSFTNESLLREGINFVGFKNFAEFLTSSSFPSTLLNTLFFVSVTTFVPFVLAFSWSIVLVQGIKGERFLRTITLYCWILPSASIGLLWMWMLNPNYGVINDILMKLGIISSNVNFLGDDNTAMIAVSITMIWHSFPWMMAFLIGGIISVPQDQIEAIRLDGGGNLKVFWYIILPNMKKIIFVILILSLIDRFQHFDLLWVMTEGGPARSTTTFAVEVYKQAFKNFEIGKAAAIGMVWVVLLSGLVFFYMRSMKDDE